MLTAQIESFTDGITELQPLLPAHWEELALNKDKVPLDPQWDEYRRRDTLGSVLYVTLRRDGHLKGYFIGFIAPGLHYKTCLTLSMDIYWTHPDIRGGTAAIRLFRKVEDEAKRRGVHRIFYGSKNHKDSSRLFKALRFEPVETYHTKWIGD